MLFLNTEVCRVKNACGPAGYEAPKDVRFIILDTDESMEKLLLRGHLLPLTHSALSARSYVFILRDRFPFWICF